MSILEERCQRLLQPGEDIVLRAEATCRLGLLSEFGAGRAWLTNRRIIWIRRSAPFLRRFLLWIPDVVTIDRTSITRVQLMRSLSRAWLRVESDGGTYSIRLGRGPYPALRDNPRTTEEWLHALGQAGNEGP